MIAMLNILENFDVAKHPRHSAETIHLMSEAMRRAYRDRAEFLGDADFTKVPGHITTKDHAKKLAATIDLTKATKSETLAGDIPLSPESNASCLPDSFGTCVPEVEPLPAFGGPCQRGAVRVRDVEAVPLVTVTVPLLLTTPIVCLTIANDASVTSAAE